MRHPDPACVFPGSEQDQPTHPDLDKTPDLNRLGHRPCQVPHRQGPCQIKLRAKSTRARANRPSSRARTRSVPDLCRAKCTSNPARTRSVPRSCTTARPSTRTRTCRCSCAGFRCGADLQRTHSCSGGSSRFRAVSRSARTCAAPGARSRLIHAHALPTGATPHTNRYTTITLRCTDSARTRSCTTPRTRTCACSYAREARG